MLEPVVAAVIPLSGRWLKTPDMRFATGRLGKGNMVSDVYVNGVDF